MGKHGICTAKYISNKIKAKALQKLRWYCQMCQKQCRDENGFKCHTMSESHHRQLLLFSENAHQYIDKFSQEFSQEYLSLLKKKFGTRRVLANQVYQDILLSDSHHTHMNATQWVTLTAFVKWLGRTGQCTVHESEEGLYVQYIDREEQEKNARKQKLAKDDEERMRNFIAKQIKKGKQDTKEEGVSAKTPLMMRPDDKPLVLDMRLKPKLIPAIDKEVLILWGQRKGMKATNVKIKRLKK